MHTTHSNLQVQVQLEVETTSHLESSEVDDPPAGLATANDLAFLIDEDCRRVLSTLSHPHALTPPHSPPSTTQFPADFKFTPT